MRVLQKHDWDESNREALAHKHLHSLEAAEAIRGLARHMC